MEYFDLNIQPALLNSNKIVESLKYLIHNAIKQSPQLEYQQNAIVEYDENTKTLKIKDEGVGIKLIDFISHLDANKDNITNHLRNAISILMANKIDLTIKSNFGTFTPIIRNKEGINEQIPSIFIAYEKPTDLANDENKSHSTHGTVITLHPIKKQVFGNLKPIFSFLQQWSKILPTNYGTLLVGKAATNYYVNGVNFSHLEDDEYRWHHHLAYSYDFNNEANNKSKNVLEIINKILQEINDQDKEAIYEKIIGDFRSFEWNYEPIINTIVKYLTNLTTSKYVIAMLLQKNVSLEKYAKQKNIKIIWIKKEKIFDNLVNAGIKTIDDLNENKTGELVDDSLFNFIAVSKLNKQEKTNWTILKDFLKTFFSKSEHAQVSLNEANLSIDEVIKAIKIAQQDNIPINCNDFDHNWAILDRRFLTDTKGELFQQAANLVCDLIHDDFGEFMKAWNDMLVNEATSNCQTNNKLN